MLLSNYDFIKNLNAVYSSIVILIQLYWLQFDQQEQPSLTNLHFVVVVKNCKQFSFTQFDIFVVHQYLNYQKQQTIVMSCSIIEQKNQVGEQKKSRRLEECCFIHLSNSIGYNYVVFFTYLLKCRVRAKLQCFVLIFLLNYWPTSLFQHYYQLENYWSLSLLFFLKKNLNLATKYQQQPLFKARYFPCLKII